MRTFGRFADLTVAAFAFMVRDIVGLRFVGREAIDQAWFMVTVTVLPAVLVSVPFGVIVYALFITLVSRNLTARLTDLTLNSLRGLRSA